MFTTDYISSNIARYIGLNVLPSNEEVSVAQTNYGSVVTGTCAPDVCQRPILF